MRVNSTLVQDRICIRCSCCSLYILSDTMIVCCSCGKEYPIVDGVPVLVDDIVEHQKYLDSTKVGREDWYENEQIVSPDSNPWLHLNHIMESELALLYKKYTGSGKEILDLGCGDGRNRNFLKAMGSKVIATDYNMIRVTRANHGDTRYDSLFMSNLLSLPLPDKYCQVIHFDQVLEHIPEPKKALASIYRVLRDDGVLILGIPNEGCWYHQLKFRIKPVLLKKTDHVNFFTLKSVTKLLDECGFMALEAKKMGWGLPCTSNHGLLGFITRLDNMMRRRRWYNVMWDRAGRALLPNQNFLLYMAAKKKVPTN